MKKKITFLIGLLCFNLSIAQTKEDAFRLSSAPLTGTARFTAMGGAFGALGGDFSALTINPAGAAVFSFTEAGLTADFQSLNNNSTYNGNPFESQQSNLNFSQAAGVIVLDNEIDNGWSKISFGINFQKTHDFDNQVISEGYNSSRGVDRYFLSYANGKYLGDISLLENETFREAYIDIGERIGLGYPGQQALFGYEGYVLNPIPFSGSTDTSDPDIQDYESNTSPGSNGYFHELINTTQGGIKKYTVNIASVYKNKLYLGLNINTYRLAFSQNRDFYESNYGPNSGVRSINFNNELNTTGSGTSFQVGMIYKATEKIRLGLSLDSPTYYRLNDRIRQSMTVQLNNDARSLVELDPALETLFPEYEIQTTGSVRGSFAYVFSDKGLISLDYTMKDYSKMKFLPVKDAFFQSLNSSINDNYSPTRILQVGSEFRLTTLMSLRAGFYQENSSQQNDSYSQTAVTAGVGFNFGASNLDISLVSANQNSASPLFDRGLNDSVLNDLNQLGLQFTYRVKL